MTTLAAPHPPRRDAGRPRVAKTGATPMPAWLGASSVGVLLAVASLTSAADPVPAQAPALRNLMLFPNDSGFASTYSLAGVIDQTGPFFQNLGTNGRSCSNCHQAADGWTITPRGVQERFAKTGGNDPIFRTVDGSNSPLADVSTLSARRSAYSMLLSKGLIRIGIGIPAGAEFDLVAVEDPYGYASANELSLFRRPLPTTNLGFLSTVMWDGRETFKDSSSSNCVVGSSNCFASLPFDLSDQSNTATLGHAQAAAPLTDAQRAAIVAFESGLFTAQVFDRGAGLLTARGARGGPVALSSETFYFGINDTLAGDYRNHVPFMPRAMTMYDAWTEIPAAGGRGASPDRRLSEEQLAVARGQALFNSKPIQITGVGGLNDDLSIPTISGTCTTCHNAPNAGDHSVPLPLAIGVADASRRTADMPLYTLRNKTSGATTQVTDPGRALITGKWKDIGRFKGPVLRALAARAPYFHNGMAKDLGEAVDFYNTRFGIRLTTQERADLIAFLRTL